MTSIVSEPNGPLTVTTKSGSQDFTEAGMDLSRLVDTLDRGNTDFLLFESCHIYK